MLDFDYDITGLRGADYNPRKIGEEDLERLAESIEKLGLVKPLIVRGDLLVAGHQRTKALRKLGRTTAAVYVLPTNTTTYDEVRFNQLHNGTDLDGGDENVTLGALPELGFQQVGFERINGNLRSKLAAVRKEICELIRKYGAWGGVVATQSGKVIHCAQYALAALMTRTPLTVYVVEDAREEEYKHYLNGQYGEFSYEGLSKDTFIQTFAQMHRLRKGESGKENRSTLYENHVIPWLQKNKEARGIDFGSGQGDYAKMLRKVGFDYHDIELFRRAKGKQALDLRAVNRMIDKALASIKKHGLFDFVVCDSVMNSVDCLEAEAAVLGVCSALCKPGGMIFFSGRKMERIEQLNRVTKRTDTTRGVEFLDKDGFTALYRKGRWFYQKFHDEKQVEQLIKRNKWKTVEHARKASSTSWQASAKKVASASWSEIQKHLEYEFNIKVSDTRRLGRHTDVIHALESFYADHD